MCCFLSIIGVDGLPRILRSSVDVPAFKGDKVRWDQVGKIPSDTWGAPDEGVN